MVYVNRGLVSRIYVRYNVIQTHVLEGVMILTTLGWHKILQIEVVGGFLDGEVIKFNPYLNCLVGGKGAGKTTIIELIRYALDAYPEDLQLRKRLEGHATGVLAGGKVKLLVETSTGQQYTIQRTVGNAAPRILDGQGNPVTIQLAQGLNFGVVIIGLKELVTMAESSAAQLALLDGRYPTLTLLKAEINQCTRELQSNREELSKIITEAQELAARVEVLPEIQERLATLASKELDALLHRQRTREKEKLMLEELLRTVKVNLQHHQRLLSTPLQLGETAEYSHQDLLEEAFGLYRATLNQVAALTHQAVAHWQETLVDLQQMANELAERHRCEEAIDDEMQARLPGKGLQEALQQRAQLTAKMLELEKLMSVLNHKEQQRAELAAQRSLIQERLQSLRQKLFEQRQKSAEELTKQVTEIQIKIIPAGNLQAYRNFLQGILMGSNMHYRAAVEKITQYLSPKELVQIIQDMDQSYFEQCTGLDQEKARKILYRLSCLTPGELLSLEDVEVEDLVEIRLRDGQEYKPTWQLSEGQKCTAILPLLLLEDSRPLLIDEPEVHLDNSYIFETVVPALKKVKLGRQLIFATHNPNIPVNGEAENILVLSSNGQHGRVAVQGDLTNNRVKDAVKWLLEGGDAALRERVAKYGDK